ncbi:MAG: hypothetical protein KF878_24890 [Planctomycetes bacterium]|nr:hypothetical protein [Planctomycetota bacterium]
MDDRLRALERAARADPADLVAGRALVQALDQAGDEVGAWRERCRLARGGDEDAWRALTALPAGARAPGEAIERVFEGAYSAEADARTVLLVGPTLEALDAATLAPRWSISGAQAHALLVGPYVAHAPAEASEVVLRLARTGEGVARVAAPGPVTALHATFDRLIVTCEGFPESRSVIVDLGEAPGATLAVRVDRPPYQSTVAAGRGLRVVTKHESVAAVFEARGVDDDVVRWSTRDTIYSLSDLGLVVGRARQGSSAVSELEPGAGAPRWTSSFRPPWMVDGAALASDLVILSMGEHADTVPELITGDMGVLTLDRRTGALGWERRWRLDWPLSLAPSRDVVYCQLPGPDDRWRVECLDLVSGSTAWSAPVREPAPIPSRGRRPLTVERGIVQVRPEPGLTRLLRLGAP